MTLEQLRIFVAVAEREHVTRAAADLNLTQSATSSAIAALEARYATKLFDRVGRRIALTEAGRLFLAEARAVLARAASAELVLADLAGLKVGSLGLAASQTVGNYWLPRFIHQFQREYPRISVRLSIGNTEAVAVMVREGVANVGFVEGPVDDPVLAVSRIAQDEMVVLVPDGHPWAGRRPDREELRQARWVVREEGSGTRAILEKMLESQGVRVSETAAVLVLPTNEAVRTAVEAGAGVAVLSTLVASNALRAGNLIAVDYPVEPRGFFMLRHKQRHVTHAEKKFVQSVVYQHVM